MKSDLDVWAVQSDKDETRIALKNVKKDSLGNILYLNCWCDFTIGHTTIQSRLFDACFYSEDSDTVILFAKGKMTEEEIESYLEEACINYTIIRFINNPNKDYVYNENFREIWIAREKYVLEDAIDSSMESDDKECIYYPDVESTLSLSYKSNDGQKCEVEGRFCKGLLLFKNKLVILVNQNDKRNMKDKDVEKLLKEKGVKYQIRRNIEKR